MAAPILSCESRAWLWRARAGAAAAAARQRGEETLDGDVRLVRV
jgi:hypothetical protein